MAEVLVTGGAGFIGSHIVDALLDQGLGVTVVDDLSTGKRINIRESVRFYEMSITDPELSLVFRQNKFDYVIHQAAQANVRNSVANPLSDARVNIEGTINVLQNCRKFGVAKVVFASTGGAIYPESAPIPTSEDQLPKPKSPYGITKLTGETYLQFYYANFDLNYLALRYGNVYGPRQDPNGEAGVVAIFSRRILNGESLVINGDGAQTRDFVYVSDVARANLLALRSPRIGIYNIGTGHETSVNRLCELLKTISGKEPEIEHGPAQAGEVRQSCLQISKARQELGWEPEVGLKEGLRRTVDYLR